MAWETKRIKDIFDLDPSIPKNSFKMNTTISFVPMECLRTGFIEKRETVYSDLKSYTPFIENDLLVAKVTPCFENRNVAIAKNLINGIGCGSSEIFVFRHKNNIYLQYGFYLALSDVFRNIGCPSMKGVGGLKRIDSTDLISAEIKIPPKTTQQKIADYLDVKTQNIDKRIELLQKKKEHYTTLRKAIINEAVNGEGKNWETHRIKELFKVIGSGATPDSNTESYYDENGYFWLQTGDLNDGIITSTSKKITDSALKRYSTLKTYQRGSLVVAMYGATIGKIGLLDIDTTTNQACCVMSEPKNINTKFLFYWFLSNKNFIISLSTGGGQPNIGQDTIKFLIVSHPDINKQNTIVNYLDKKTSAIDSIIEKIKTEIDTLKTYRRALINEAVTGKLNIE